MENENTKAHTNFDSKYILGCSSLNMLDFLGCMIFSHVTLFGLSVVVGPFLLIFISSVSEIQTDYLSFHLLLKLLLPFVLLFLLFFLWNLIGKRGSFYKLLHESVKKYLALIWIVFFMNPCGVIITIPILKIWESRHTYYLKQYEVARGIESFKRILANFGMFATLGISVLILIANIGSCISILKVDIAVMEQKIANPGLYFDVHIIGTLISFIFLVHILYKMYIAYSIAKNLKGLEILPDKYEDIIDQRLDILIDKLPLNDEQEVLKNCNLRYLIDKTNYAATPSMIVSSGYINIIFPLGYFKAIKTHPEAADAMLAHELAHYLHSDSSFLLWLRCYYKSVHKLTYFVLINMAIGFFAKWAALGSDVMPLIAIIFLLFTALAVLIQDLLMMFLRSRVEFAEELADVFASIAVSPLGVTQFLEDYIENDESAVNDSHEQSFHPSVEHRLQIAEHLSHSIK